MFETKKLSRDQTRSLDASVRRGEPIGYSAFSLTEIAILVGDGRLDLKAPLREFFADLEANPIFRLLPITSEIAADMALLRVLRDPAGRTITATARVHRLDLLTSDRRIIESNLTPTIE